MIKNKKTVNTNHEKKRGVSNLKKTRIILALLLVVVLLSFAGCSQDKDTIDPDTPNSVEDNTGNMVDDIQDDANNMVDDMQNSVDDMSTTDGAVQ